MELGTMNIFALDNDPVTAAQMQCDKHVVKMVLETAQMLSTVHHEYGSQWAEALYRPTHRNHPCTIWAGENTANYRWLMYHFKALAGEYCYRYDREHLSWQKLNGMLDHCPPTIEIASECTPFARAMPEQYKYFDDPVDSYRMYYAVEKAHILQYTRREMPRWLVEMREGLQ